MQLPAWWVVIPWLWLAGCGLSVWIGYVIFDLTSEKSQFIGLLHRYFGLADVEFMLARTSYASEPIALSARVSVKRFAPHFGCYVRMAVGNYYIGGGGEWRWSTQEKVEEGVNLQRGRVLNVPLLTIHREENRKGAIDIFSKPWDPPQAYSKILRFEVVVSSKNHRPPPMYYTVSLEQSQRLDDVRQASLDGFKNI